MLGLINIKLTASRSGGAFYDSKKMRSSQPSLRKSNNERQIIIGTAIPEMDRLELGSGWKTKIKLSDRAQDTKK